MPEANYKELIEYLDSLGIDANRIPADGFDSTGYDYWPDPAKKGPWNITSTGIRNRDWDERKEWPNPEVYKNFVLLLSGATLSELIDPKVNKERASNSLQMKATPKPKANPVVRKGAQ